MTPQDPPATISELVARQAAIAERIAKLRDAMAVTAAQVKATPKAPPTVQGSKP